MTTFTETPGLLSYSRMTLCVLETHGEATVMVNDFEGLAEAYRTDRYRAFRKAELSGLTQRDLVASEPLRPGAWWQRLSRRHGDYAYTG